MPKRSSICLITMLASVSAVKGADDSVYFSLRNRMGLLRYCQDHGLLDEQVAVNATQRLAQVIKGLPAAADPVKGDALEDAGSVGKWGQTGMSVEQRASTFGLSLKDQCTEWSE